MGVGDAGLAIGCIISSIMAWYADWCWVRVITGLISCAGTWTTTSCGWLACCPSSRAWRLPCSPWCSSHSPRSAICMSDGRVIVWCQSSHCRLAEYTPHTSLFIIIGFAAVILSVLAWVRIIRARSLSLLLICRCLELSCTSWLARNLPWSCWCSSCMPRPARARASLARFCTFSSTSNQRKKLPQYLENMRT